MSDAGGAVAGVVSGVVVLAVGKVVDVVRDGRRYRRERDDERLSRIEREMTKLHDLTAGHEAVLRSHFGLGIMRDDEDGAE